MPIVNPTLPNDGETADASDIDNPILAILAVFNGHIAADNIEPGSLTAATLASGAVVQNSLSTSAGELGGTWTTFTPTWNNLTVGNGTTFGRYYRVGKTVRVVAGVHFGSTTALNSSAVTLTLPFTATNVGGIASWGHIPVGLLSAWHNLAYAGRVTLNVGSLVTQANLYVDTTATVGSTTVLQIQQISSTLPWTWNAAVTDGIFVDFVYEMS